MQLTNAPYCPYTLPWRIAIDYSCAYLNVRVFAAFDHASHVMNSKCILRSIAFRIIRKCSTKENNYGSSRADELVFHLFALSCELMINLIIYTSQNIIHTWYNIRNRDEKMFSATVEPDKIYNETQKVPRELMAYIWHTIKLHVVYNKKKHPI